MTVYFFKTDRGAGEIERELKKLGLRCAKDIDPQYQEIIGGRMMGNGVTVDPIGDAWIVIAPQDEAAFDARMAAVEKITGRLTKAGGR